MALGSAFLHRGPGLHSSLSSVPYGKLLNPSVSQFPVYFIGFWGRLNKVIQMKYLTAVPGTQELVFILTVSCISSAALRGIISDAA